MARYAREKGIDCEVSLENLMACGLGACLCCVEKVRTLPQPLSVREGSGHSPEQELCTPLSHREGQGESQNVCVCKEGPVFDINRLLW